MHIIPIGVLVPGEKAEELIPLYGKYGFESFAITFWKNIGDTKLVELAKRLSDLVQQANARISSVSVFGNPLVGKDGALESWEQLIQSAHLFGTDIVSGFTGRIPDRPIPESMDRFKEVFGRLGKIAGDCNVKIAFENCDMGGDWHRGDWNIAHNPTAWEMMFDAVPLENLGLEWEPCHQMVSLIDPIPQLRKWVEKVFHVHGKDASIAWDVVKEHGVHGPKDFAWHRSPGFGDTNWVDVVTILLQNGYNGSIDIEGYHDPVMRDNLEFSSQVESLLYLKRCRGGSAFEALS